MKPGQSPGDVVPTRWRAVLMSTLLLAAAGCAGQYGKVRFDVAAGRAVEAGTILEGHRYYTIGSETVPLAILALREDHPLRGGPWQEVPMTAEALARMAEGMRGTRANGPDGHIVLDGRGAPIGAWYSYSRPPVVRLFEDGGVEVSAPFIGIGEGSDAFRPGVY